MTRARQEVSLMCTAHGVGMIEVLIAVLVLSIGLLGVAALQGFALQSNQTAYQRSQATNVAYDLLDYMRAHHREVCENGLVPDFDSWASRAESLLPSAELDSQSDVVSVNTANCDVTITIAWTERDIDRPDEETLDLSFILTTRL